jgi:hypothetical protein
MSEAGIQSIDSIIIKRCLNWWIKLINAPANSYIKLCYNKLVGNSSTSDNWANKLKNKLFPDGMENIWDIREMMPNDFLWHQTLRHHETQFECTLARKIHESSSLYWYKYLVAPDAHNFSNDYLTMDLSTNIINTFSQIRLLNIHNERIYVNGNSYQFNNNQNCTICNYQEKDTLQHLLTRCNITNGLRRNYLSTNNSEMEILVMMKSGDKDDINKIVLRIRSFVLCE